MKTILFDMDGTLTAHRRRISQEMVKNVRELTRYHKVGILTGSKFEDIQRQCGLIWDTISTAPLDNLVLLPCNGTKVYTWGPGSTWKKSYDISMKQELGTELFRNLVQSVVKAQSVLYDSKTLGCIDIMPDFLDYRGSLLNWSPIGRSSEHGIREKFIKADIEFNIRDHMINLVKSFMCNKNETLGGVSLAKGGQTSVDIFPDGWDKTYAFNHFSKSECTFVGDACNPGQNDYEIFAALQGSASSFHVKSPHETLDIINNILKEV